ncbi:tetratricopeptide repeat-containing sensor histidine kinase [Tenacibaculum amylolyticum]|uniref:tetratricopeptide repeat-containing sensor histidine kinase n=1 Tax=Tenacibaculum amylolyticum TaxID=104269 RepID=UPI0038B43EE6
MCCRSQTKKHFIDSTEIYLSKSFKSKTKDELLFLKKAVSYADSSNVDSLRRKSNIRLGLRSFSSKNTADLKLASKNLIILYNKNKDSISLAKFFHFKALENRLNIEIDSAFFYYQESKRISQEISDSLSVGMRLLSISNLQREAKDYLGSEISSIEALQYLEPKKAYKYLESVYNNLGLISFELKEKEESLKYYEESIKINSLTEESNRKETSYLYTINNIGLLYQNENLHKKAIDYFLQGLAFENIREKYPVHYALLLENLTYSQYQLGENIFTLQRYEEVLEIRKKYKVDDELSTTHLNIADYYVKTNQKSKAKFHANEAIKYAQQTHNNKRWLEALDLLSDLTTGKQSKQYLEDYIALNDSLLQQERRKKNQFAKIRYETGKKEKENEVLKTENKEKQAEITYRKQQNTISWLATGISILFLLSSISFFTSRRKRLLYEAQLQKAEAREHERKQIAKSLHDEVAGDLRLLHRKLEKSSLQEEAQKLEFIKDNVRNLSHQLSSVSFKEVPFKDQIINLISDYFAPDFIIRANGLKEINWEETNKSIKRLLYLSIRECIQNCQKYAQASKMTINFSIHKKSVLLEVNDNGIGFDTNTQKKGIGLQNLQERVDELNGTLTVESNVGEGTQIHIQIPLNA